MKVLARGKSKSQPQKSSVPAKTGRKAYRGEGELWDLKDKYLAWLHATGYAAVSIRNIHSDLSWFMRHLEKMGVDRIADVTSDVLEGYSFSLRRTKNGLNPSMGYISHRLNTLRQFFKWLTMEGLILCNPADDIELPKMPQEIPHTILSQEEARRLVEIPNLKSPLGYRDRALLELLYSTGIRSTELMRLKVKDMDFSNNTVSIWQGKWHKDRLVPSTPYSMAYVKEYIEKVRPRFARFCKKDDGTLFLAHTGSKLEINRLCEIIRRNTKAAGITKRVTAMTLRHTIMSALLENGMGVRQIQEFAGHVRLASTQIYTSVTLTGLRKQFRAHHPRERRCTPLGPA